MKINFKIYRFLKQLQDALNDGNAIVAILSSIANDETHAVLIYSMDNENFKVKDSYGEKYKIPMTRPDSLQVKIY